MEVATSEAHSGPVLSLVVPMFNEGPAVANFFKRLIPILDSAEPHFEIVCVDDGSSDDTLARLEEHAREEPRIQVIELSRNFGKEAALTAGLDSSGGLAVIPIDADLQDPPELIPDMLALWRQGFDVVLAERSDRSSDRPMKRVSARWFYKLIGRLSDIPIPADVGDYRLMDRQVVEALKRLPERSRFMKGILAWLGFRTTSIRFVRAARQDGEAKHNYRSLLRLAVDGLVSFTTFPLRVWTLIGLSVSFLSVIALILIVGQTLIFGRSTPGYASLMVVLLLFNGIILINLGIMGEYISRIFIETKQRPVYLIRRRPRDGISNRGKV